MKTVTLLFILISHGAFVLKTNCDDQTIYANKKQTGFDTRFDSYPKIKSSPHYKSGDKKLEKLIYSKLKLSEVAKTQIFFLNFMFTVTCEGKINDIRTLGDPRAADWTNIAEIIAATEADWKPAEKDGKNVSCIYFRQLFVYGPKFK